MRGESISGALLACATLVLGNLSLTNGPCDRGLTWWDARSGSCHNCTVCDAAQRLTVLRPCELHRDTLCVPLRQLDIQWPRRPRTRTKQDGVDAPRAHPKVVWRSTQNRAEMPRPWHPIEAEEPTVVEEEYEDDEYTSGGSAAEPAAGVWDVQSSALTLAVTGCIMFFVVVICLSLYYTRQWRRLKITLERDVQDMSARLRLIESGPVGLAEAGGVTTRAAEGVATLATHARHTPPPPPPSRHFYSNIPRAGKDPFLDGLSRKGLNNVYTQEKHTS